MEAETGTGTPKEAAPATPATPAGPAAPLARFFALHGARTLPELPELACSFWFDALLETAPMLRPARGKVLAHLHEFWNRKP
jgi:hypothetical protein